MLTKLPNSRSGEPNWSAVTSESTAPAWSKSVNWKSANILNPETYKESLENADAVVHSMGILLEADYKGVVSGQVSPIAGLQRAFSSTKVGANANPMEASSIEPGEKDGQITYELMNRDSAIILANTAAAANVGTFGYISAAAGAPILPKRYITTKREAESTIASKFPKMRSFFVRPGFLYDSSRGFTIPMAALTYGGFIANSLTGGNLTWLMGAGGSKPLKADLGTTNSLHIDPLTTDSSLSVDLKPAVVDLCLTLNIGKLPNVCIRQPYHHHIGFTLWGTEVWGFSFSGEQETVIQEQRPQPKVALGAAPGWTPSPPAPRPAPEPPTRESGGLRIRLGP